MCLRAVIGMLRVGVKVRGQPLGAGSLLLYCEVLNSGGQTPILAEPSPWLENQLCCYCFVVVVDTGFHVAHTGQEYYGLKDALP